MLPPPSDVTSTGIAGILCRGVAVCVLVALAETVHGTLRTIFLAPVVGDLASRQIGVFSASVIIFLIAWATIGWIGAGNTRHLVAVGLLWLVLMLSFEVGVGRAFGLSWERIVSDYIPWRGGFMIFGMTVLTLSPLMAARLRARQR